MMVTFSSMCEKKALIRTRRVLDAFADRIGAKTWQTIITEEGLVAVKQLLRKTASKNTAVACHWRRSASRTDLLWIVGNRNTFNAEGIVPVNITQKELFMDEYTSTGEKFFANTHGQLLEEHLFAIGFLAKEIVQKLLPSEAELAKCALFAGFQHDLGKLDPKFQDWVKKKNVESSFDDGEHISSTKFSFEKHPRHNEVSLILKKLLANEGLNSKLNEKLEHTIYWHHAKPIRKKGNDFDNLEVIKNKLDENNSNNIPFSRFLELAASIIKRVNMLSKDYSENLAELQYFQKTTDERVEALENSFYPNYKVYPKATNFQLTTLFDKCQKSTLYNAKTNILRSALITADRLISKLDAKELSERIQTKRLEELATNIFTERSSVKEHIKNSLNYFERSFPNSQRNKEQAEVAKQLSSINDIAVLAGPAGCGKTKIALEWALKKDVKRLIWVCPRVQICQALFTDLQGKEYLPDANIELFTGEFKESIREGQHSQTSEEDYFSGDVIITTIDQVSNAIITHRNADSFIDFMDAHIVFDEYHEYITMSGFNLLFAELLRARSLKENGCNTLLVSATPHYYFLENILDVDLDDVIQMKSFNESSYQLEFSYYDEELFDDSNPFYQKQPENTIVISNTALTAQRSFIQNHINENSILFHSKFTRIDKKEIFNSIYNSFKKHGLKNYDVLRSGPIVQASLNITCDYMVTEFTNAENFLQRLGRLDRFGENSFTNKFAIAVPQSLKENKRNGNCARFLNRIDSLNSSMVWFKFIEDQLNDKEFNLNDIYRLYRDFYKKESSIKLIEQDIQSSMVKSIENLKKNILEPVDFPRKKQTNEQHVRIKKNSLRGNSRFVQMAEVDLTNPDKPLFLNSYAYPENYESASSDEFLTASIEEVEGYDNSEQNLLTFMFKKHHNIKSTKKAYKDYQLLKEATSPEFPIYLSYTPSDLSKVNTSAHPYAVYYAKTEKQPIGTISINKLTQGE